jgi:hypothetical protein
MCCDVMVVQIKRFVFAQSFLDQFDGHLRRLDKFVEHWRTQKFAEMASGTSFSRPTPSSQQCILMARFRPDRSARNQV